MERLQRHVVGYLAGAKPSSVVSNRYSEAERAAAAAFLADELCSLGLNVRRHDYRFEHDGSTFQGSNVYAIVPATVVEAGAPVLLGAHYDTVEKSPGANDNASGVAAVLAVAHDLVRLPVRSRPFIVVFFDQEERALIGARAFAEWLRQEGVALHSAHTVDQLGWDADGDQAIEVELPTPELETLYREVARDHGIPVHTTRVGSTDHRAFRERGYAAVGLTEEYWNKDTTPYYHKPTDTMATVDFAYLASSTQVLEAVMRRLAREERNNSIQRAKHHSPSSLIYSSRASSACNLT